MPNKERVSLSIEPELLSRLDRLIERSGGNRSEVLRDLIRDRLIQEAWVGSDEVDAVATVTLIYDHAKRELADRMLEVGHDHHDVVVASMHVHLDKHSCLEVLALRGRPPQLRQIADQLIGMKGVQHGQLFMSRADP